MGIAGCEKLLSVNGLSMKASEVEAKLDEGDIEEAESSLREGLALNFEVMPAIHGTRWDTLES